MGKYWGAYAETLPAMRVEFKRPLLRAELSSTADTSGYTEITDWYARAVIEYVSGHRQPACDRLGLPTVNDLQTLYTDYPQ